MVLGERGKKKQRDEQEEGGVEGIRERGIKNKNEESSGRGKRQENWGDGGEGSKKGIVIMEEE